ncbi:MAG: hypothetical protein Q7J75_01315 [Rhodoferax sp.]|nr:hypothetical protein [Rhodoferax sp.]
MIGLLFFGAITLWGVMAISLGIKLPKWMGIQRYRLLWTVILVPLLFVAPVADEIIAWPQMQALCKSTEKVEFNRQTAAGATVSKHPPIIAKETKTLFPNIQVLVQQGAYVAPVTETPVVRWNWIEPHAGFLNFPAGSSGGSMPLLLNDCGFTPRNGELKRIVDPLGLVKVDYEPTKYK